MNSILDPKWLEILKASGWQTLAIAFTCGLFLLLNKWGWLPPLAPWMIQFVVFVGLLCALLTLASLITAALKIFPANKWIIHYWKIFNEKENVKKYIPHMTSIEKEIIAYLLAKNQKTFTSALNGGYANTLISRKFIVVAVRPGQTIDPDDVPMAIPDHVWDVLIKQKDRFVYTPPRQGDEVHPWRVPWLG